MSNQSQQLPEEYKNADATMAEFLPSALEQELLGIKQLLWGNDIKLDVFKRWSQGFYFSQCEPTALEQLQGGPCAVIAPVQAFILKNLMLKHKDPSFRDVATSPEAQNHLLINALSEILEQCNSPKYYIAYLLGNDDINSESSEIGINNDQDSRFEENGSLSEGSSDTGSCADPCWFHDRLRLRFFPSLDEVRKYYFSSIEQLKSQYGILLFLYSVIATRGLERVQMDSFNDNETPEPLIDSTYGYGSQSLINLVITGRATHYVWDHEQDVCGLKLKGLEKQSQVGFITLMEDFRYCTVGSFYKNPIHPVWVMASETHLTVLFSYERRLVSPETKTEQARRVFKNHDPDGNNFINSKLLQDVLKELDLVSEEPYVEIMRKKLDPENLGIILLNAFMDEFFPKEETSMPDTFVLFHYNGLSQSNINGQVRYRMGECVLLECDLKAICESNQMLTVLQTKWPNIEVKWNETEDFQVTAKTHNNKLMYPVVERYSNEISVVTSEDQIMLTYT